MDQLVSELCVVFLFFYSDTQTYIMYYPAGRGTEHRATPDVAGKIGLSQNGCRGKDECLHTPPQTAPFQASKQPGIKARCRGTPAASPTGPSRHLTFPREIPKATDGRGIPGLEFASLPSPGMTQWRRAVALYSQGAKIEHPAVRHASCNLSQLACTSS